MRIKDLKRENEVSHEEIFCEQKQKNLPMCLLIARLTSFFHLGQIPKHLGVGTSQRLNPCRIEVSCFSFVQEHSL